MSDNIRSYLVYLTQRSTFSFDFFYILSRSFGKLIRRSLGIIKFYLLYGSEWKISI